MPLPLRHVMSIHHFPSALCRREIYFDAEGAAIAVLVSVTFVGRTMLVV